MPTTLARRPAPNSPTRHAPLLAVGLAGLIIAACGQSNEEKRTIYADCITVISDADLQGELGRASTTPDAACTCVQAELEDDGDDREQVAYLLGRIANQMEETGAGAEDAMGRLIGDAMLKQGDGDGPTVASALPVFNEVFEETLDAMAENEGVCPAV